MHHTKLLLLELVLTKKFNYKHFYALWEHNNQHGISLADTVTLYIDSIAGSLRTTDHANREIEKLYALNGGLITPLCEQYPVLLTQTAQPPVILWYQGAALQNNYQAVSIVGAREATSYALNQTAQITTQLAQHGITIISGGARGIDTQAHKAALSAGGVTIVVAGAGLTHTYPPDNKILFQKIIAQGGTLVSPFPLEQPPTKYTFPRRNRLIAALAPYTVVMQAAARSGALITAQYALEYNRELGAIPGPLDTPAFYGSNALLQKGAAVILGCGDIMRFFSLERKTAAPAQEQEVHDLVALLTTPHSFDQLLVASNGRYTPTQLQKELFALQLEKRVIQHFSGLWERV